MVCPVCGKKMTTQDFGGVQVDVCLQGCKGIWFDWLELRKLNEKNEGFGQALQEALKSPRVNDANRPRIKCPKCGIPMYQHQYPTDKEINVDECYGCAGFFLDSGEFKEIRDHSMTDAEEHAYLTKMVNNMPESKALDQQLEKDQLRSEAIRKYTRFLRLSYYMTGR